MADASCSGPSPFKRLVDHQSRDVSHHQDRLVDRSAGHPHGAGFRSARQQDQGPDSFSAFMNGASAAVVPGLAHDPANRLAVHAAAFQQPGAYMSHHHPQPLQQARAFPVADVANWAADFTRFSNDQQMRPAHAAAPAPAPSSAMQTSQLPLANNFQSVFGPAFGGPLYGGPATGPMGPQAMPEADFDKEMSQWMSAHGAGDMPEVDAAMDQMARELELEEATQPTGADTTAAATADTTAAGRESSSPARFTDLETPEIGHLSLGETPTQVTSLPPEEQEIHDEETQRGKSAVSEAAGRLLESVQHESGDKWQNSVFLSLMRDFRDGRKDIIDNEIRVTHCEAEGPSHEQPT